MVAVCDVLVVEDDTAIREAVCDVLSDSGISSQTANNGKEALLALASVRPGVILIDLAMPEMDGTELQARLRANPEWASIPVIQTTASWPTSPATTLRKPFDADELLQFVRTAMERSGPQTSS